MTIIDSDTNDSLSLEENDISGRKISFKKHTETIDNLFVQNKNLQKELDDVLARNDYLEQKLKEGTIKISKNIFFIVLFAIGYVLYTGSAHINTITNKLVEMNVIMSEYKRVIEKTEIYNRIILEKEIGLQQQNTK